MRELTRKELIEELEQYYEAAGFDDVKIKRLYEMSNEELREIYKTNIEDELVF